MFKGKSPFEVFFGRKSYRLKNFDANASANHDDDVAVPEAVKY